MQTSARTALARERRRSRPALREVEAAYARYVPARAPWFQLVDQGKLTEAAEWRAANTNKFAQETVAALGQLIAVQRRIANEKAAEVATTTTTTIWVLLGTAGIALLATMAVGFFLARSISRPLTNMTTTAQAVAGGNLEAEAQIHSNDEVGILASAFNQMTTSLRNSIETDRRTRAELAAHRERL